MRKSVVFRIHTRAGAIINGAVVGAVMGGAIVAFRDDEWVWSGLMALMAIGNIAVDYGLITLPARRS